MPEHDYIPLFALLGSQLTNEEVSLIATELEASADPESAEASSSVAMRLTSSFVSWLPRRANSGDRKSVV